jgi:hypothetical protein
MTPLDYTTCVALKAAGFPQKQTGDGGFYYYPSPLLAEYGQQTLGYFLTATEPIGKLNWPACPSSDELLAAIQARWPDYRIDLGNRAADPQWFAKTAQDPRVLRFAPTPVAALALLYIQLAQVSP